MLICLLPHRIKRYRESRRTCKRKDDYLFAYLNSGSILIESLVDPRRITLLSAKRRFDGGLMSCEQGGNVGEEGANMARAAIRKGEAKAEQTLVAT